MKKANISILVIFVLLAASLLGLLTMYFVQQLVWYSWGVYGYYQSYYLSKAWLELGLSLDKHRGLWFSYQLWSGRDDFFADNFLCASDKCSFDMVLQWQSYYIVPRFWLSWSCADWIELSPGDSLIIPLFYDDGYDNLYDIYTAPIVYNSLMQYREDIVVRRIDGNTFTPFAWLILGDVSLSGNQTFAEASFFRNFSQHPLQSLVWDFYNAYDLFVQDSLQSNINFANIYSQEYQHYLIIANPTQEYISLCTFVDQSSYMYDTDIALPTYTTYLSTQWSFGNNYIHSMQAVLGQNIPQFLIQSYINF